jgi:hypothetical protein
MLTLTLNIFMMLNAFLETFYAAKMAIIHKKRGKKMTIVLLKNLTIFDYKSNMKNKSLIILL